MTSKAEASFVCKSFGANLLPDKAPEVGVKTVLKKKQVRGRGRGTGLPFLGLLAGQSVASNRMEAVCQGRPHSMTPSTSSTVAPCLLPLTANQPCGTLSNAPTARRPLLRRAMPR